MKMIINVSFFSFSFVWLEVKGSHKICKREGEVNFIMNRWNFLYTYFVLVFIRKENSLNTTKKFLSSPLLINIMIYNAFSFQQLTIIE